MVKPILRFIDQPYRHVAGDSVVFGLAAVSIHGISSVQVTVSDGVNPDVVGSVSTATWNSINADWVPSFNVQLDLTGLNDGPVTVTALATDGAANTQTVVQAVNNNSGGTLGDYDASVAYVSPTGDDGTGEVNNRSLPFATIAAAQAAAAVAKGTQYDPGACSVLLEAGGYTWGDYAWGTRISGQTDWLRIAPAPGVTREQARITGTHTYGIGVGLFWLDGISIELNQTTFIGGLRFQSSAVSEVLLTDCSGYDADNPGTGTIADNRIFQNNGTAHQYVIGGTFTNIRKGFGADLVRGVTYGRLGEDVCSSALCVINITFQTITRDDGSWHPDVYQFDVSSPNENIFVFGIRGLDADCQMLFQGDGQTALRNACFINVMLATDGSYVSQFESGADHLLIWHCHIGQTMRFETQAVTLTDVSILNSYVESLQAMIGGSIAALEAAATIDHLSQGDDGGVGTNPIAGSTATWEDAAGGDYRLLSTDPGYEACPAIAELDYLDGSRAARNASTPDAGPFPDAADPTVGFLDSETEGQEDAVTSPTVGALVPGGRDVGAFQSSAPLDGPAAPTLTVTDSLDGRTLTITVDSLTGSPPPTAELTTLTLDGCDVRDQATGSGPWVYELPASTDTHTVVWGVTATNSEGTAIASGSEVVDGGSSTAPSFTVESSASLEGRQITITPGVATGSPSPTLSIAATLDSVPITMTGSGPWTYDVPSSSAAQLLEWVVTATNSAGSDTSAGNVTIDEDLFAPAIEGLPWVVGAAVSGQTLVATAAPATGTPTPTRSWQWYRAPSTAIAGATSSSYTLQVADEGLQVFVRQTEINSEGSDTADSAATVLVTAPVVSSRRPLLGLGRML
jgi:hypothetical protein